MTALKNIGQQEEIAPWAHCCAYDFCFFSFIEIQLKCGFLLPLQVEPAGPGHRAAVHHGHNPGGDRGERLSSHQPHHHTDHASAENSTWWVSPTYRPSLVRNEEPLHTVRKHRQLLARFIGHGVTLCLTTSLSAPHFSSLQPGLWVIARNVDVIVCLVRLPFSWIFFKFL